MMDMALKGPVHFVGVGGSGMSPLAEILRARGFSVSGSDAKDSATTRRLACLGVRIHEGHAAAHLGHARTVVVSSAIKESNPEFREARARGLDVLHRGDVLQAVMAPASVRVAVSGSHGKTTTTAMSMTVLAAAGFDPSALVGAALRGTGSGARTGAVNAFVAEADESDRSFLKLRPTHVVVTNVDREHLDTYRDLADVTAAFKAFAQMTPATGASVLCADDPVLAALARDLGDRAWTYGSAEGARVRGRILNAPGGFARVEGEGPKGDFSFTLRLAGAMNGLNALGAMALAQSLVHSFPTRRSSDLEERRVGKECMPPCAVW